MAQTLQPYYVTNLYLTSLTSCGIAGTRWATVDESPRDFAGVEVTAD
jgi:hypothetical protein